MKKYIIMLTALMPLATMAQNVWEKPESTVETRTEKAPKSVAEKADAPYLAGAVPVVDGKVQWTMQADAPGKSAQQLYDIVYKYLNDLTHEQNQLEGSSVTLVNRQEHSIIANVREWLVFKNAALSLDRTKFYYTLMVQCSDGRVAVTMSRLSYRYEEERQGKGEVYKAEDWITDENALNKKKTKLYKGSAKFRRKTIDRKDEIFSNIQQLLKQ